MREWADYTIETAEDGAQTVEFVGPLVVSSIGAIGMFLTPFMMAFILRHSLKHGAKAEARAWEGARGLEWTVPSPAPHHTFEKPPVIKEGDLAHGDVAH